MKTNNIIIKHIAELAGAPVTFVGWKILRYAYNNPKSTLCMNRFARNADITFAHISRTLKSLSSQGFIKFKTLSGRSKTFRITPEGKEFLHKFHEMANPEFDITDKLLIYGVNKVDQKHKEESRKQEI